jgi:hypothetical protein
MKTACIAYDEAYFTHNKRVDFKDMKGKGKKTEKAQTAATGSGSVSKRLSDQDWEMCKVKGLCFVCKKFGKDIFGLAKEHPNHTKGKPEDSKTQKKGDSKKPTKKTASIKAANVDNEYGSDVDRTEIGDSDSDDQTNDSKN